MSLALGGDVTNGLVFRLALETNIMGGVERVVLLALCGEEGRAECVWPVLPDMPAEKPMAGVQLRLIADDGYEGPSRTGLGIGARVSGATPPAPCRRAS